MVIFKSTFTASYPGMRLEIKSFGKKKMKTLLGSRKEKGSIDLQQPLAERFILAGDSDVKWQPWSSSSLDLPLLFRGSDWGDEGKQDLPKPDAW